MGGWWAQLDVDPLPGLLAGGDEALIFFVRRDLLDEDPGPVDALWELPEAARILRKQRADGAWRYQGQGAKRFPYANYDLLETFRKLGALVEMFGFSREHPAIERAAGYLYSCQTDEGELRGILGNQTMPYYHGAILAQLIAAGYGDDPRTLRGLDWLLSARQDDGGWMVPAQGVPPREKTEALWTGPTVRPDPARPSSHLATGMALRALAVHPGYQDSATAREAGDLLKGRFFQSDKYNDRRGPEYWLKFQYPFWWTNLVTALDSLARMGYPPADRDIAGGLAWFRENQEADGLWPTGYGKGRKAAEARRWVGLAIGRVLKAFSGSTKPGH
jgi:hypothetical protein